MKVRLELALAAAVAAALGAIAATIWVGAGVREETIVARPYEEGLRHDAERRARAALGLSVKVRDEAPEAGAGPLAFEVLDREGRPLAGARVRVSVTRPGTSRGERAVEARVRDGGGLEADLSLPEPGPWDVRFDVLAGEDRVRLERRLVARAPCDLADGPCTHPLPGGGELTLELSPRPLRTMRELAVRAEVRPARPAAEVRVAFSMPGMEMGRNEAVLRRRGDGRREGTAVLVPCPSGWKGWVAEAEVARSGEPPEVARFRLTVAE